MDDPRLGAFASPGAPLRTLLRWRPFMFSHDGASQCPDDPPRRRSQLHLNGTRVPAAGTLSGRTVRYLKLGNTSLNVAPIADSRAGSFVSMQPEAV
jgi:hypothetical protein